MQWTGQDFDEWGLYEEVTLCHEDTNPPLTPQIDHLVICVHINIWEALFRIQKNEFLKVKVQDLDYSVDTDLNRD